MILIFTNVYRYSDDSVFIRDLHEIGLKDDDTIVFLNSCVPYFHAQSFFNRYKIITINRRQGTKNAWFEYSKVLSIEAPHITRLRLDDEGTIIDEKGDFVTKVDFKEYPNRKVPTTGWLAFKYIKERFQNERVVPVNYFGMQDGSTKKFVGHNWLFEDDFFAKTSDKMFLQQEGFVSEYKYLTPDPYKKRVLIDGRTVSVMHGKSEEKSDIKKCNLPKNASGSYHRTIISPRRLSSQRPRRVPVSRA